jgi:hypothetical protein
MIFESHSVAIFECHRLVLLLDSEPLGDIGNCDEPINSDVLWIPVFSALYDDVINCAKHLMLCLCRFFVTSTGRITKEY